MEMCNGARYDEHMQVAYEKGSCPVCEARLEVSRLEKELTRAEDLHEILDNKVDELRETIEELRNGSIDSKV